MFAGFARASLDLPGYVVYDETIRSVSAKVRDEDMKEKLSTKELIVVGSMLFGMFFGAGNLIFPISMGQLAGEHVWQAAAGFLVTGVGIPLLGVAALGISRENGVLGLSSRIGKRYGIGFTCMLCLTVGPFFAIPRCATVSYTVGLERFVPEAGQPWALAAFSLLFFGAVLFFSLRPGEILTWIGKVLNPLFLILLAVLVIRELASPMGAAGEIPAQGAYASGALFQGMLEGYNTMDVLAGLLFGMIVVTVVRDLGARKPEHTARNTVKAGIFSSLLMAAIYILTAVVGAQSRGVLPASENGGQALALIAEYYFGIAGAAILAATVTVACLKTAVGLITSCGETFANMFPGIMGYREWTILFSALSCLIANLGLNAIIEYSLPALMFLYPLAITLILLALAGGLFGNDRGVYRWVTGFTAAAALVDFVNQLPREASAALHIQKAAEAAAEALPFSQYGFGWVIPALLGLAVGLCARRARLRREMRPRREKH